MHINMGGFGSDWTRPPRPGPAAAARQHRDIVATMRGTAAEGAPVIPIAAMAGANLDVVCECIAGMSEPVRDLASPARMVVVRSFCVNKPGATPDELQGGIAGGSILRGSLRVGEQVELRPGVIRRDKATGRVVRRQTWPHSPSNHIMPPPRPPDPSTHRPTGRLASSHPSLSN